jgi:hypothetical protein
MVEFSVPDGYEIRVYAAGANDATKVQYKLTIDDDHDLGGSWQESPLGSILAPWSFTAYSGGYIRARQSIRYHARNIGSDPQDVGARLHLEVVPVEE